MSLKTLITNSVDYNVWVTEQLVAWLQSFDEELLYKECPSSFSSIAKTLKHISDTQLYWSAMIRGTAIPTFDYIATEVDIKTEMENLVNEAKLLAAYVKENEEGMSETYLIKSEWFSSNFPKYEYLQHLIIHTTYHRGQIVTIGHHVKGTKAPMMDYNFWNVMSQQAT
ncbi:DinB family protein [Sphingobacterium spiritivorum ATCC 33300]|uniref:DinB family protein n=1 Tax=Sphingobacterium spiritivorum ATCC 33300 TaxID=525372 RepID=C2FVH6_SPHSI|nr:DinB family protein [Sphingobacterium spiritivorum]EEI93034.1 DinB family protein [Sphingobacterium spiritivorum ATCC 33300]QQS96185.1 DinB family protein [Sphingobacterium spiritivorum]